MNEFVELKSKREEMQTTMQALDDAIMRIQTHAVSSCLNLQESAKKIIGSVQEYDHSFFSEGLEQEIKKMKSCISSLEVTLRGNSRETLQSSNTEVVKEAITVPSVVSSVSPSVVPNQIKPSTPRWWDPFLKIDRDHVYTVAEISKMTGYSTGQIKKQFCLQKISMSRTLSNVWVYDGSDIYNKACEMTGGEQHASSPVKTIIQEKIQADKIYKVFRHPICSGRQEVWAPEECEGHRRGIRIHWPISSG